MTEHPNISSLTPSGALGPDETSSRGVAWVEGEYMPIEDARISILENGFTCSDCTYDVVGVWDGAFFRLDDHLDRLFQGCERLRIDPPAERAEVREMLFELVRRSGLRRSYVQVIVTRGVRHGGKKLDLRRLSPALYGYALPYMFILEPERHEVGVDLVVARTVTRIPPTALDPLVKNFHWGDFVRGQLEANERGGSCCLLTDGQGLVTEGAGYNVFALVDGTLHTPADWVLHGITRKVALEIAEEAGIPTAIGAVPVELLSRAEEIFVTSTAGGVMGAATLDGRPVGAGKEGPTTRRIRERYWELHYDPRHTEPVDYDGVSRSA